MDFGPFALISLIYVVLGVRVVSQLVRHWRTAFDRRFTAADRKLVDQAAFFVLVPIAVGLHELGHAVAIWLFGGTVIGFGYFGFAGYVAFDPRQFSSNQEVVVAAAGTIVNILLGAGAMAFVLLRRPPVRAAINQLLVQFTLISLLNALVLYPVLDFVSNFNGDWRQMYGKGDTATTTAVLLVHAASLGLLYWLWRDQRMNGRIARLTGATATPQRLQIGRLPAKPAADASATERVLHEAATRVASGWSVPVDGAVQRRPDGVALVLSWQANGVRRSILALATQLGGIEIKGAAALVGLPLIPLPVASRAGQLDVDRLTLMLRLAMETVDQWSLPVGVPSPQSPAR